MLRILILFSISIISIYCREICYGDLGCFTDSSPFGGTLQRPIAFLPDTPEKISVKFTLYNKNTIGEVITASNIGQNFVASIGTKFITHGFLHNAIKPWVLDMKNAILSVDNVNVITVDWSKGNGFPYTQATANTQVVGAEIAKLINALIQTKGAKAKDFHLIGHSLGAHISGYAGFRVAGLGKITGLDAAGPYFENTDPIVRLDPTDAIFVENIHTDGTANLQLGLGLFQPIGHLDIYPNGGKDQPNCPETPGNSCLFFIGHTITVTPVYFGETFNNFCFIPGKLLGAIFNGLTLSVQGIEDSTACSHSAAFTFYTESIKNKQCKFTAYPCSSLNDFNNGKCLKCSSKGCNTMGYWSSPTKEIGSLYLLTQDPLKSPLCIQNYVLTLYSSNLNNIKQAFGKFTIFFKTSKQTSSVETFDDYATVFKQNSVETRLISLNNPIDVNAPIVSAFISYKKTGNILTSWQYDNMWSFKYITILVGDNQQTLNLCPQNLIIDSNQTVEFNPC